MLVPLALACESRRLPDSSVRTLYCCRSDCGWIFVIRAVLGDTARVNHRARCCCSHRNRLCNCLLDPGYRHSCDDPYRTSGSQQLRRRRPPPRRPCARRTQRVADTRPRGRASCSRWACNRSAFGKRLATVAPVAARLYRRPAFDQRPASRRLRSLRHPAGTCPSSAAFLSCVVACICSPGAPSCERRVVASPRR